jgi:hypothetical protein
VIKDTVDNMRGDIERRHPGGSRPPQVVQNPLPYPSLARLFPSTSVTMIEDHYRHMMPVKNADRILLDLPGWQPGQLEPGL